MKKLRLPESGEFLVMTETFDKVTAQVDALMHTLYRSGKGRFAQALFASPVIADHWRNYLLGRLAESKRAVMRLASINWAVLRPLGFGFSLRISFLFWFSIGVPLLLRKCFHFHSETFTEEGDDENAELLLRTGVSNEPNIATWLSAEFHDRPVNMLSINEGAGFRLLSFRFFPLLFDTYRRLAYELMHLILSLHANGELNENQSRVLPPVWLVLLARRAPLMSQYRCWASIFLSSRNFSHLYFTMNTILEGAFIDALPCCSHICVEHGFPRRDIPPLLCRQYVYGVCYADYLRSYDPELVIKVIGNSYFPADDIGIKERTIVIASLQDWPQWGIANVAECFNTALSMARGKGWKVVFRGRNNDEDAFARGLTCKWDEISSPKTESFAECLQRIKPAMIWTTWSTAVLDAEAMGVQSVCFVDDLLLGYFIIDFPKQSLLIASNEDLLLLPFETESGC